MMILTMPKEAAAIGKDKEGIKTEDTATKMMIMALIQEGDLAAVPATADVVEWKMKVQTGAQAVTRVATAIQDQVPHPTMVMETEVAVLQTEGEVKVPIGARAAVRDEDAEVIPMNKATWEEVVGNHVALKMKEGEEVEAALGWGEAGLHVLLQTDVAVAAATGSVCNRLMSKSSINKFFYKPAEWVLNDLIIYSAGFFIASRVARLSGSDL